MKSHADVHEQARRFNEEEAIREALALKRLFRALLPIGIPLPEETLDWLDRQAAERERRLIRAVGHFHE